MRDRTARVASTVGPTIVAFVAGVVGAVFSVGFIGIAPAAADGEVTIEVMANGNPADSAPGPTVESGATVTLRYVITVASSEPLFDFVVTNLTGDVKPNCDTDDDGQPDGADGHPGPLRNGESFSCVASIVAGEPGITFATAGRVTAYDAAITQTFVHDDAAHYTTIRPTTTQAPTTQPPTTAAPTTNPPTTPAPTTATTQPSTSTSSSTTSSTSTTTRPTMKTTASSSTTRPAISPSIADEDGAPPDELAATDDDSGAFPLWWVVLAFAVGGAIAAGVGGHLSHKKTTAPDQ